MTLQDSNGKVEIKGQLTEASGIERRCSLQHCSILYWRRR